MMSKDEQMKFIEEWQKSLDDKYGIGAWHCDDIADDPQTPQLVVRFLNEARKPAIHKTVPLPDLYATVVETGVRVKVVFASRLGDVGIHEGPWNSRHVTYQSRVYLPELKDFSNAV